MIVSRTSIVATALAAVAVTVLSAACGNTAVRAPVTPTDPPLTRPTTVAPASVRPTDPPSTAGTGPGLPVTGGKRSAAPVSAATAPLPWPAADATDLQGAVDAGGQPWLLDPSEVAAAYAAATYGWTATDPAELSGGTPGATTVEVTSPQGAGHRTLILSQPGRRGPGGVWLVTADY